MIILLQILTYLALSGIPISAKMNSFLSNLDGYNMMPNAFDYIVNENEGALPYLQAQVFGYNTDLMLLNVGSCYTILLAFISAFPFLMFMAKCSLRWLGKKFVSTLKSYQYSFFIRF